MPLHSYGCKNCGHEVEVLVIGKRGVPEKCEKCGGKQLERKLGGFSVSGGSSVKRSKSASSNSGSFAST
jgi:putative FmdB family regulatory protein